MKEDKMNTAEDKPRIPETSHLLPGDWTTPMTLPSTNHRSNTHSSANLSMPEIEDFLDSHADLAAEYFVRKADLSTVNKWLVAHGFLTVTQGSSSRRGSTSLSCSPCVSPSSPIDKIADSIFADEDSRHRRSNSKKYLRHNFAKSKSKSMFRTCENSAASAAAEARRSSFRKAMRKYSSLPPSSNYILCLLIESKVRLPRLESITLDTKKEIRQRDEKEFFLDIVKDIANDLDLKGLTHKIIVNLGLLLNADGASLFIVQSTSAGKKVLVSKVFDVHSGTNIYPATREDNAMEVPWGKGIIGHVAETGDTVNLECAFEDPRYNDEVDRITGYHTDSLLCMAVRNYYGEIIAVAQVVNKNLNECDGGCFTAKDERVFETYLQFVGIAITNAQLMEVSQSEYERNRSLLEVVHDLFEEQTSLENVVLKTLQRAQRLLKCERAAVLLLEDGSEKTNIKFSKIFELNSKATGQITNNGKEVGTSELTKHLLHLAEQVASSGENLNIADSVEVEKGSSGNVRSMLAMPIRNRNFQIIGVAKIINKLNGQPFDENDEQLFEAFTIFCGLGINNTLMYNELEKAMARQKVAIEVLSYHATASHEDVDVIQREIVPEASSWDLGSLTFDDFSLSQDQMVLAACRMFYDLRLAHKFKIESKTLQRWLITVRKNYRNVPYHNWRHAFNVAHNMFALLKTCGMQSTYEDIEWLGMFVGCLCHDLDHRGTNNSFQEKTGSALALLYGTQNTMEQHHFNHAVMILNSEGHNIFSQLSSEQYSRVMNVLKHSILATDLSLYFQVRTQFFPLVSTGEFDTDQKEHRDMLRSLLMTACDIAASTKPWDTQLKVAKLVTSEFFDQGDLEKRKLKITPPALMDRDRKHELPILQMRWIKDICLPLFDGLAQINPKVEPMRDGALRNMTRWAKLAASQDNGELKEPPVDIPCTQDSPRDEEDVPREDIMPSMVQEMPRAQDIPTVQEVPRVPDG